MGLPVKMSPSGFYYIPDPGKKIDPIQLFFLHFMLFMLSFLQKRIVFHVENSGTGDPVF